MKLCAHIAIVATTIVSLAGFQTAQGQTPYYGNSQQAVVLGAEGQPVAENLSAQNVTYDNTMLGDAGSCGCDLGCNDCCYPRCGWEVDARFVYLHRSGNKNAEYLLEGTAIAGFNTVASTFSDLDLRWEPGARVEVIRHTGCDWSWSANYLGVNDWTSRSTILPTAGNLLIFSPATTSFPNTPLFRAQTTYDSELHTFALHARRRVHCTTELLFGFRYLSLDENFRVLGSALAGPANDIVGGTETFNDLYGFETGVHQNFWDSCKLRVDGVAKIGIYNNRAVQNSRYTTGVGGAAIAGATGSANNNHAAFVGELEISLAYKVNNWLQLVGGYQFMWIEGVATAPRQLANPNGIDTDGSPFFHGGNVGAIILF